MFLIAGWQFMQRAARFSTPALGMPNLIFYLPAIIGMSLMLLVAIDRAVAALDAPSEATRPARHDEPRRDLPVPGADVPRPADRGRRSGSRPAR